MKINQFIDQLYWATKFGRPIKKIKAEALFANPKLIEDPIFFLSTGRCGTEWFINTLKKSKGTAVFHEPAPNLSVQNKFIYQLSQKSDQNQVIEVGNQLFFAGREQYLRQAYKTQKRYIETNNHITFFAYSLAELFPTAKFIHLYRHPGSFVTSGINRGWFESNDAATEKIIVPTDSENWSKYSQVKKISWVWNETNSFIEDFKKKYSDRTYSYDFSKRDIDQLYDLFQFIEIPNSKNSLKNSLAHKKNVQRSRTFPSYKNWEEEDKKALADICGELCKQYNYEL